MGIWYIRTMNMYCLSYYNKHVLAPIHHEWFLLKWYAIYRYGEAQAFSFYQRMKYDFIDEGREIPFADINHIQPQCTLQITEALVKNGFTPGT